MERLASLLDSALHFLGTQIHFGYGSLLGFFPGVGDALTLVPSGHILAKYSGHGMPATGLIRMAGNIGTTL